MVGLIICMILSLLCVVYGIVVKAAGSGTWFYLVWFGLGILILGLGVFLHLGMWNSIPSVFKKMILVLAAIGVLVFGVIEGLIISQMHQEGERGLDYLLVLGAQVREDGPCLSLRYRLDKAMEYLEENPDTLCIVSGGQGYNEPFSEAEGMAAYLREKGMDENRLILEDESRTTAENVRNSMKLIREGASVGIITNDFHMFRAMQIARSQGMKNICGISAKSTWLYLPNNMFREFFAEIKHLLQLVRG